MKRKPIDYRFGLYSECYVNSNDPKFKVDHHGRISKYENIFAKGYTPIWLEEVLVIRKFKITVPWTYVVNNVKDEEIVESFYENNFFLRIKNRKSN